MGCGVGHRHSSDPVSLWLWHGLAATAPIRPLAWEAPYASGVALEKRQKKKKDVVHIYNEIRLSHKNKQNNAICSNMGAIRDYYIE